MTLQETLAAFSNKSKSADDVMRAIMNYSQFQAPALYAMEAFNTQMFERVAVWGTGPNTPTNGDLWIFTDDAAANVFVSKGGNAGPFATGLQGWTLFENLPDNVARVQVNPGSPPSAGWMIHKEGFPLTRIWAQAIKLEHLLATGGSGLAGAMVNFPAFTIFTMPNGAIATAVGAGGMKNPAMLFTTPDCAEVLLTEAGPAAANWRRAIVSGKELFGVFDRLGVDGLVTNVRGPGVAQVLRLDACRLIIESADLEAKAAKLEAGTALE
jgi:hypothetical protein